MALRRLVAFVFFLSPLAWPLPGRAQSTGTTPPHVVVVGVNGMELDVIRPLLLKGDLPNLAKVIKNGAHGKLRTVNAPNCPRVYSTMFTSTQPEEHGVTGFLLGWITANTNMLKQEPIWSVLSKNGITVGMANVPATFPVMPVNGYMISGMLTRGKNCEDGVLCAPKLSEVEGGDAVYPAAMKAELLKKAGDFYIDCERMPSAELVCITALLGSQAKSHALRDERQERNCLFRVAGFSATFWLGSPPVPPALSCPTQNSLAPAIQRPPHCPVATW
jgi:Type I phosphodiesterase / nucleotide pyrophosphatase